VSDLAAMMLMVIASLIALSIIWGTYVVRLKISRASVAPSSTSPQ
jgi:hypothetical protein